VVAVSERELTVDASLDAIAARNGALNAILSVAGHARGATGTPLAVKDNIVTTDLPTTCGSRILRSFVSLFEATRRGAAARARFRRRRKANLDESPWARPPSTPPSA